MFIAIEILAIPASATVSWGAAGIMIVQHKIKSQDVRRPFLSKKRILKKFWPVGNPFWKLGGPEILFLSKKSIII
jgi:hypothetical protein